MSEKIRLKVVGALWDKLYPKFDKVLDCMNAGNNEIILFCDYSEFDIPIGHNFTRIENDTGDVYSGVVTLMKVTDGFSLLYESIPKGFKTICKFEVADINQLSRIKKLPIVSDWYGSKDYLIFGDTSK